MPTEETFLLPPTDTGEAGGGILAPLGPEIAPPIFVPEIFVECVPGYGWNGRECVPGHGGDPLAPEGGGSYSPGSGGGTPPTTTTDPAGGGQVVPQGAAATGPTHGSAAGPEVASAGAGEEMLGWILGAIISAALISRER